MSENDTIKQYKTIKLAIKKKILKYKNENPNGTIEQIAKNFNVTISNVGTAIKRQDDIISLVSDALIRRKSCTNKNEKYFDVDNYVLKELETLCNKNVLVRKETIGFLAQEYKKHDENFSLKITAYYAVEFLKRNDVKYITLHRESASVDASVVEDYILEFPKIREGYEDAVIFNIDESALYIRKLINKPYVINKHMDNKNIKFNKTRVTLMLGYNMIEDELIPLIIGISKNPCCFKDNDLCSLGVKYVFSKSAWMTANIFSNYLKNLNEDLIKEKRSILLILYNFSGHKIANISNIKLELLPKVATTIIQPLDQSVIKTFKSKYLRILNSYLISSSRIEEQNIQQLVKSISYIV
ncbi:Tigger transposable element-derived protein 1 [Cucumispora dikerogammari]|nr:Tigger transposable element-derived protein 1 [Cucumispora dikerogammari]